jgi:hypothetical protein
MPAADLMLVALVMGGFGGAGPRPPPASAAAPATTAAVAPSPASAAASSGAPIAGSLESQRRRDLEDLQRQDVARTLLRFGLSVDWQEHKLAELTDWRDRVEVASALRADLGVEVDWRTMTLAELNDIRLRAAKSAELANALGATVDWRRYSWRQLEEIRRAIAKIQGSEGPATAAKRKPATTPARPTSPPNPGNGRVRDLRPVTEL